MILKSPTTTLLDKIAVLELEKIAKVKYQDFGKDIREKITIEEFMEIVITT